MRRAGEWLRSRLWAIGIVLYFLAWTSFGLRMGFSYDDVTNLYQAWTRPLGRLLLEIFTVWSTQTRPVGGLVYRGIYAVAGFHPLPFHAACLVLLLLNLGLQYRVYRVLADAGPARLALVFGCFHASLWSLYTNAGTLFDILCGTFYFAALWVYVAARRREGFGPLHAGAVVLLTVLALGAKEMALSLPLVLVLYEALFFPAKRGWAVSNLRRIGPAALVCGVYVAGRLLISGPLTGHPAYRPLFTLGRLKATTTAYARLALGNAAPLPFLAAILFWAVCLAVALRTRSRLMLFGLLFFAAGVLPLLFVDARRDGYVLYVPLFGLALAAAAAFDMVRRRLPARFAAGATAAFVCAVVAADVLLGARLVRGRVGPGGEGAIRITAERLPRLRPKLAAGSRVLLVDSPFGEERYVPGFVLGLLYHSKELHVVNAAAPVSPNDFSAHFDYRFVYRGGDIFETTRTYEPPPAADVPTTVRLVNLTRPGRGDFNVGERFELVITGVADEMVTVAGSQNAAPALTVGFGRTDGQGRFRLTGKMAAKDAGSWTQLWRVGSTAAPEIDFTVKHRR